MLEQVYINRVYVYRYDTEKYDRVKRCPYYTSLVKKSPSIFTKYVNLSKYQSSKKSAEWRHFYKIYKNIKKSGFDFDAEDKVVIKHDKDKFKCIHGRHRICMLYKMYGNDLKLILSNGKLVDFTIA